ncbi:AMP-binding protein [Rhodococcus sp. C26F]
MRNEAERTHHLGDHMNALPAIEDRTMPRAFARVMSTSPDKTAFVEADGTEWTYRGTVARSLQVAAGLLELGVNPRESVALMLDNSFDFLCLAFGLGLSGRVQVPVNTAYKGQFLAHILRDSGARVLVMEDRYADRLTALEADVPDLETVVIRGGDGTALRSTRFDVVTLDDLLVRDPAPIAESRPADLMAIMYTSGTTGLSKGVEISHAHAYTYASREDSARPNSDDRILVFLPMFHLAGQWYGAYQSVIAGATAVLQPAFSVTKFWDWIREFDITETVMLGAVAELLQQAEPKSNDWDNPLTFAVMAPLASDFEGFRSRFGVEVGAVYGMSELGAVMFSDPPGVVAGEAGRARSEYEFRLVDESGNDVPDGSTGELLVRAATSEQVMRGYHGLPEKTAETLVDGWVHTGDIFRRDAERRYYFIDRKKDALRRRGENVSSFEVERVINGHPDVLECAVVAAPSDLVEDEIKAVLVPREGRSIDLAALTTYLASHMPYFMVPRYFEIVSDLPKTPTQKIQKHLLRGETGGTVWDRESAGIRLTRHS